MRISFGIDLAAYGSKAGTVLAAAKLDGGHMKVALISDSSFARTRKGASDLLSQVEEECSELTRLTNLGPVAIDVPIDLQGLPSPRDITRTWELTRRPIDRAFGALAPLADKLGYCVARFQKLIKSCPQCKVGQTIFETYPAASLQMCDLPYKRYKRGDESVGLRRRIADDLGIRGPSSGPELTHDELDAVICAIASAIQDDCLLEGEELREEMLKRLKNEASNNRHQPPKGYRLLRRPQPFSTISVSRCIADDWFGLKQ